MHRPSIPWPSCRSLLLHSSIVIGALIAASIQSVCAVPPGDGQSVAISAAASEAPRVPDARKT